MPETPWYVRHFPLFTFIGLMFFYLTLLFSAITKNIRLFALLSILFLIYAFISLRIYRYWLDKYSVSQTLNEQTQEYDTLLELQKI